MISSLLFTTLASRLDDLVETSQLLQDAAGRQRHDYTWGDLMAISGEISWPPLGRNRGRQWGYSRVRRQESPASYRIFAACLKGRAAAPPADICLITIGYHGRTALDDVPIAAGCALVASPSVSAVRPADLEVTEGAGVRTVALRNVAPPVHFVVEDKHHALGKRNVFKFVGDTRSRGPLRVEQSCNHGVHVFTDPLQYHVKIFLQLRKVLSKEGVAAVIKATVPLVDLISTMNSGLGLLRNKEKQGQLCLDPCAVVNNLFGGIGKLDA